MPVLSDHDSLWSRVARERSALHQQLSHLSWPDFKLLTQKLEKRFPRLAKTDSQRREVRRRFAADRLLGGAEGRLTYAQFKPLMSRVERLGFSNVFHQQQVAGAVVEWSVRSREGADTALRCVAALHRRILRTRHSAAVRRRLLLSTTQLREWLTTGRQRR